MDLLSLHLIGWFFSGVFFGYFAFKDDLFDKASFLDYFIALTAGTVFGIIAGFFWFLTVPLALVILAFLGFNRKPVF